MARAQGKVKWFSEEKGYGFISQDNGADVFVHHQGIEGAGFKVLHPGEPVEFEIIEEAKGLKAINVVRLDPSFAPPAGARGGSGGGQRSGGGGGGGGRGGYGGGSQGGGFGGGQSSGGGWGGGSSGGSGGGGRRGGGGRGRERDRGGDEEW